jgi:hypothetical protein
VSEQVPQEYVERRWQKAAFSWMEKAGSSANALIFLPVLMVGVLL